MALAATGDRTFSRLVQCREDGIDEALEGLRLPDARTANQLLKGLARLPRKHVVAQKLLAAWEERHCDITAFHYSTVINACGRAGDWPRAVQLIVAMGARAVRPDTIVYNSAISACAGSWPQALQLLEMLTGCELSPDTLTFNCLITACSEKWQLGLQLIRQAVHGHATPDAVTYNAAMRGCQGAKEWRWALKLMEEMSEARLAKDQITYTTALSGLERQWELALTLLHDLEVNAVQADAQVYTAFVVVCGRASQWQRSLELLRSDVADTAMCNALITACGQGMEWETSLALLAAHRSRADAITLSATVSACCDARQWEAAIAILGAGAELNTAGFNAILGGCEWDVVLALLEEMDRRRVAKDSLSFSTAITACERAEEWDASFSLLDERLKSCQDQRLRRRPFAPRSFLQWLKAPALELRRMLRSCGREAPSSFRVNPLKAAPGLLEELRRQGWKLSPVPWLSNGFSVTNWRPDMGFNRAQLTGEIYFQEATSMLPAEVLQLVVEPGPGEQLKVLDMCAAPGSKSTQLGTWLMGQEFPGFLVANEPDAQRAKKLEASLLRMGIVNAMVTSADGRELGDLAPEAFDAVLADVPCSCEGNARKDAAALLSACGTTNEGPAKHKEELVDRQQGILQSAWRALKPGGFLVYSTCTFDYWENEGQCQRFLAELGHGQHAPEPIDVMSLLGLPNLGGVCGDALQIWPQSFDVEGFFVSCFRKPSVSAVGSGVAATAAHGEGPRPLLKQFNLTPLSSEESLAIQSLALSNETVGWWPSGKQALAKGDSDYIWLLPELEHWNLGDLEQEARAPGIHVATESSGQFVLSDDVLLLAGSRAKGGAAMSKMDWAKLQAAKEAGGKWIEASKGTGT